MVKTIVKYKNKIEKETWSNIFNKNVLIFVESRLFPIKFTGTINLGLNQVKKVMNVGYSFLP